MPLNSATPYILCLIYIFFHSSYHLLAYSLFFYFQIYLCPPPLECNLYENRNFSIFFTAKTQYKEWNLTHAKHSVNICYIKLAKTFHHSVVRVSYQAGSWKEIEGTFKLGI